MTESMDKILKKVRAEKKKEKQMSRLDSKLVLKHIKKHKHFTTDQIAEYFKKTRLQAAAAIAILRIKEVVEPDDPAKDADGSSRWVYIG